MEKVPNLDIFSHRQLKKSNSLSRINHNSSSRPSSAYQPQRINHLQTNNYYDQAVKMLNLDSKIISNLRNIENRQEGLNKTSLKKVTKNIQNERKHVTFMNNPQVAGQVNPPQIIQTQQVVKFSYPHQFPNTNIQNIHPPQSAFTQQPTHFMNQTAPQVTTYQQGWIPPHQTNINMRVPQNQHIIVNHLPPQNHLQRINSAHNLHFRDYSQPDKVLSTCKIENACNNEEQQKIKQFNSKKQQYTFRNEESVQSGKFKVKPVTLNPFLFDATYLLDIRQSQNRLPDLSLTANHKECYQQMQKKKDLIEQLIEIKQANQIDGQNILRQLDSLIEQFDTKTTIKDSLEESQFRSSRRSMFSKLS